MSSAEQIWKPERVLVTEKINRLSTGTNHVAAMAEPTTGITPEILAVIETAATAFVGKKVRIISVRLASGSRADSSVWANQGRDIIHESHNLVQRGH